MASKVQIILEDDIDGSRAAETINFSLDGVAYEIDLSEQNAAQLREDIQRWVTAARRTGGRQRKGNKAVGHGKSDTRAIRAWAHENGVEVSDRGRISADVREAYAAAAAN